jgi:hypothetical protein
LLIIAALCRAMPLLIIAALCRAMPLLIIAALCRAMPLLIVAALCHCNHCRSLDGFSLAPQHNPLPLLLLRKTTLHLCGSLPLIPGIALLPVECLSIAML